MLRIITQHIRGGGGSANKSAAVKTNEADRASVVNLNKFNKIN